MPDRIIRDELLESDRYLALPDDGARIAFFCLLLTVDDFGNCEGSLPRLLRLWRGPVGDCTIERATTILADLVKVGLVRAYSSTDGSDDDRSKEYLHIPRFNQKLRYPRQGFPMPEWQREGYVPDVTAHEWRTKVRPEIIARDNGQCAICSSRQDLNVDHVIPLAHGGRSTPDNLITLCRPCHAQQARFSHKDIAHLQSLIQKVTSKSSDKDVTSRHSSVRSEVKRSEEKKYRAHDPAVDNSGQKINGGDSHPPSKPIKSKAQAPPGMTVKEAAQRALARSLGIEPFAGEHPDAYAERVRTAKAAKAAKGRAH